MSKTNNTDNEKEVEARVFKIETPGLIQRTEFLARLRAMGDNIYPKLIEGNVHVVKIELEVTALRPKPKSEL